MADFHSVGHLGSGVPRSAPLSCSQGTQLGGWPEFSWLGTEREGRHFPAYVEDVYLHENVRCIL